MKVFIHFFNPFLFLVQKVQISFPKVLNLNLCNLFGRFWIIFRLKIDFCLSSFPAWNIRLVIISTFTSTWNLRLKSALLLFSPALLNCHRLPLVLVSLLPQLLRLCKAFCVEGGLMIGSHHTSLVEKHTSCLHWLVRRGLQIWLKWRKEVLWVLLDLLLGKSWSQIKPILLPLLHNLFVSFV